MSQQRSRKYAIATVLVVAVWMAAREGHGALQLAIPPSGTLIANFEGAQDATTLTCNVLTSLGVRTNTAWFLQDFDSNPGLQAATNFPELFSIGGEPRPNTDPVVTFQNELTIRNHASSLDRVTVFCGTGTNRQQANFTLRVYRPPSLRDNFILRVEEDQRMVPVNLTEGFAAFPEPSTDDFSWTKNGQTFTRDDLTYSTVMFDNVQRADSGSYNVSATNFILNSMTEQIGNDTGSFYLDVLYGPTFQTQGPAQHYVLQNDTLSLICGTGLDSNPRATVTWTAPDMTTITDNARYDLENGPGIVRLNFTHTILSDTGTWRCQVEAVSEQYIVSGGALVHRDPSRIGQLITVDIELVVISEPRALLLIAAKATSLHVQWDAPLSFNYFPISYYSINTRALNSISGVVVTNTSTNATFVNVTDLSPGITYELTVVAVSQGGDTVVRSKPSAPLVQRTALTVPALMCNDQEVSNGGITVSWSYIHTGGLPLDTVSISYTFEKGATTSNPINVPPVNTETTLVNVPSLVAGVRYTFNVTAVNNIGSSSIICGPTFLVIGIPATPVFGELTSGPNPGEVTVQIKTIASGLGVNSAAQSFQFNIIPVRDGVKEQTREFILNEYQSGTFETLAIWNLQEGQMYNFKATAINLYGTSDTATSESLFTTKLPGSSKDGAIGALGGVLGVVVVTAVMIITILVVVIVKKGKNGKTLTSASEGIYEEPENYFEPKKSIDSEVRQSGIEKSRGVNIEMEACKAYGKLPNTH